MFLIIFFLHFLYLFIYLRFKIVYKQRLFIFLYISSMLKISLCANLCFRCESCIFFLISTLNVNEVLNKYRVLIFIEKHELKLQNLDKISSNFIMLILLHRLFVIYLPKIHSIYFSFFYLPSVFQQLITFKNNVIFE